MIRKLWNKLFKSPTKLPEKVAATPELTQAEFEQFQKKLEQALAGMKVVTMEDLLRGNDLGGGRVVPFITTTDYNTLRQEMHTHELASQEWTDLDFCEQLLAYYNEGYELEGLVQMYERVLQGSELSQFERNRLKQWFTLLSMEQVLDV